MRMTIPNILTLLRLGLIPIFVIVFYLPFDWAAFASALIFFLAAFTDWLDGMLARMLKQTSRFGAFLDPVADKIMVAVALILITESYASWWITIPAATMIAREIVISALREWMAEIGKRANIAVSWIGKWKTTFQMFSLMALIWQANNWITWAGYITLYVATALTYWSMYQYLRAAKDDLLDDENE